MADAVVEANQGMANDVEEAAEEADEAEAAQTAEEVTE